MVNSVKTRLPRCLWCEETFHDEARKRAHVCRVYSAIREAEVRAQRVLTHHEVRAVRDRARKALAMDQEFHR